MRNRLYNMFTAIKNGQIAKRQFIIVKYKKICELFLQVLWDEGFIMGYTKINQKNIKIYLKYKNNKPVINSLNSITKPGKKIHYSIKQIWKINSNKSFILFSTHKGIKTIKDCKKLNLGGEALVIIN